MKASNRKKAKELLGLKYPVQLLECEEGGYYVKVPDLPGCQSQGESIEEALANIEEARRLWIEGAVDSGIEVPLPEQEQRYSGKFVVRLPKTLHARLARAAVREDVSLNQLVVSILSAGDLAGTLDARLQKMESCINTMQRGIRDALQPWSGLRLVGNDLRIATRNALKPGSRMSLA